MSKILYRAMFFSVGCLLSGIMAVAGISLTGAGHGVYLLVILGGAPRDASYLIWPFIFLLATFQRKIPIICVRCFSIFQIISVFVETYITTDLKHEIAIISRPPFIIVLLADFFAYA